VINEIRSWPQDSGSAYLFLSVAIGATWYSLEAHGDNQNDNPGQGTLALPL